MTGEMIILSLLLCVYLCSGPHSFARLGMYILLLLVGKKREKVETRRSVRNRQKNQLVTVQTVLFFKIYFLHMRSIQEMSCPAPDSNGVKPLHAHGRFCGFSLGT